MGCGSGPIAAVRWGRNTVYAAAARGGGVELPFATAKVGVIARSPDSPGSKAACARRPSRTNIRLSCIRNIRASPEIRYTRKGRHESTVHLALAESPFAHALADRLRREPAQVRPCEIPLTSEMLTVYSPRRIQ